MERHHHRELFRMEYIPLGVIRVLVDCALAPWMVAMTPGVNPLVDRFSPHVQVPVPRVRDVAVCLL